MLDPDSYGNQCGSPSGSETISRVCFELLIIPPGSDENAVNNLGGLKGGDVAGILPAVL
jgi:hypothetical protein